jgi:hypothetical protein
VRVPNRRSIDAAAFVVSAGMILLGALERFYGAIVVGGLGLLVVAGARVVDRRRTSRDRRRTRSEVDAWLARVLIGAVCIAVLGIAAGTAILVIWGAEGAVSGVGAYLGSAVLLWWAGISFRRWREGRLPAQRGAPNG